jgi:hypothetical protein
MKNIQKQTEVIKKVVDKNREFQPSPEEIAQFEALVTGAGWELHDEFRRFVGMFYGVERIDLGRASALQILSPALYLEPDSSIDRNLSLSWLKVHGEYLIPVGDIDMTLILVSEAGKLYGDTSILEIVELYGNSIEEGIYNIMKGKSISAIEFDESRFDD